VGYAPPHMTIEATWAPVLEALRRALEAAASGRPDPDLTRGAAFTLTATAINLPHGDDVRNRLENGSMVLRLAASHTDEQCLRLIQSVVSSIEEIAAPRGTDGFTGTRE
jgi:hypothetical protein